MNNRRTLIVALSAGAFAGPLTLFAQQPQRVYRVGFLFAGTLAQRPQAQGFWEGLRELGYIPGKNVVIDVREAEGKTEKLPDLAKDIVSMEPDVIVAVTPAAIAAAQSATRIIPIVMAIAGDVSRYGFVKNLARPEGNTTGSASYFVGFSDKRLQLLHEMLPRVSRIGVLWNAKNAYSTAVQPVADAAKTLGIQLVPLPIHGPDDLDSALAGAVRERCGAILVLPDPITFDHRAKIIAFVAGRRLPTFHAFSEEADDGGLAAYGVNLREEYRKAAPYVDKILKGIKPSDIPVEQPTIFAMVINMKTAKALGIKIPNSILVQATKVIE